LAPARRGPSGEPPPCRSPGSRPRAPPLARSSVPGVRRVGGPSPRLRNAPDNETSRLRKPHLRHAAPRTHSP